MRHRSSISSRIVPLALVLMLSIGSAAGEPRTTPARESLAAAVSRDSLESMVRYLSIDPGSGQRRSRFTFREAELATVADTIVSRLERYAGANTTRISFAILDDTYSNDSTFTAENIAVRKPGTGAVSGVFLITAHIDAIASRTEKWDENWKTWPAPGANDNGTGIAAVLEAARVLADYSLPFDVLFVLFSAEEIGLLGSRDFVERFGDFFTDDILGVLNLDMIGYPVHDRPGCSIISDFRSGWLVDLMSVFAEMTDTGLEFDIRLPGPPNSDHVPFWEQQLPAVSFMEPLIGSGHGVYPYYHTLEDTAGWVDFEQVGRIADLVVNFLLGLIDADADPAVLPNDLLLLRRDVVTSLRVFNVGDSIRVVVRVRNTGAAAIPQGSSISLRVTLENSSGRPTILATDVALPEPLRSVDFEIPLYLEEWMAGTNIVNASISVTGSSDLPLNNKADIRFGVEGGREIVLGHHFQPNPVRTSFGNTHFCLNLAGEARFMLEFFSLEGEQIGSAYIGDQWGRPVGGGLNCFPCGELFPSVSELAAGVYVYRLVSYEPDGSTAVFTGRFAVEY